jgi:hypothetical protein
VGVERVIGGVDLIDITANGVAHFAGQCVNRDLDAQDVQTVHKFPVEGGHGAGDERQHFGGSLAGANRDIVLDDVKIDVKGATVIGNSRGGQPERGDVQGDMPPVVEIGRECHADFAHDLCPQVQRLAGLSPGLIGQRLPALQYFPVPCVACVVHGVFHLIVSLLY